MLFKTAKRSNINFSITVYKLYLIIKYSIRQIPQSLQFNFMLEMAPKGQLYIYWLSLIPFVAKTELESRSPDSGGKVFLLQCAHFYLIPTLSSLALTSFSCPSLMPSASQTMPLLQASPSQNLPPISDPISVNHAGTLPNSL